MVRDEGRLPAYLREMRLRRGVGPQALASAAGIGRTTLHRWEAGESRPRLSELDAALTILNATDLERQHTYSLLDVPRARAHLGGNDHFPGALPHRGDLLRSLRARRGLTQSETATRLGVRQQTLARWESMQVVPSDETLSRLCALLGAYPEESQALQSSQLVPDGWLANPGIDLCAELVASFLSLVQGCNSPLADLHALALKRQLWLLVGHAPEALRLLAVTNMIHGCYLQMQIRRAESKRVAWEAIYLTRNMQPEFFWTTALQIASQYVGTGSADYQAKANLLATWLPRFSSGYARSRMQAEIACWESFMPGHEETALHLIADARQTLESCSPAGTSGAEYIQNRHAMVLLRIGRPLEAMALLPVRTERSADNAWNLAHWAEAHIMSGGIAQARRLLDELEELLRQFSIPTAQRKLELLAAQIKMLSLS